MARYRERSRTVWAVVASLVERFEQVGIDEGYLDLTGLVREPSDARALLGALQAAVRDATGLSCSLGCGTGKTVAKIASDHRKPGGVVRRRARPRGGVPGAAAAARAARHRAARRAAAAGGGPRDDRRPRPPGRRRARGARHGQGRPRPARARPRRRSAARRRRGLRSRHDRRGDDVRPRPARPARDGRRARADRRERVRAHRAPRLRGAHRDDEAALLRLRHRHALAHAAGARRERGRARAASPSSCWRRRSPTAARPCGCSASTWASWRARRSSSCRWSSPGQVRRRRSRPRCARRDARATGSTRSRASRRAGTAGPCA